MTLNRQPIPEDWLEPLECLIRDAGAAIMAVYESADTISVETKADESPLTAADRAAHQVIAADLARLTPEIPLLSEESALPPFAERRQWSRYWLVDPLDGTKEFISRNGEFTVNIALIDQGEPVLGLVYAPVTGVLYGGVRGQGAWRQDASGRQVIKTRSLAGSSRVKIVASRRHGGDLLAPLLARVERHFAQADCLSVGSSLKLCMLAEGVADWYPRLAPTSEWDTAAAQAVLEAAGGVVVDEHFRPLPYNTRESVLNPFFHALADPLFDWPALLRAR